VGDIGLTLAPDGKSAEIGYALTREAQTIPARARGFERLKR